MIQEFVHKKTSGSYSCVPNYRGNYKQIPSTRGPKFNLQSGGMIFDNRLFCGCKTIRSEYELHSNKYIQRVQNL